MAVIGRFSRERGHQSAPGPAACFATRIAFFAITPTSAAPPPSPVNDRPFYCGGRPPSSAFWPVCLVNKRGEGFIYYDSPGWTIGSPLDTDLVTPGEDRGAQHGLLMRWSAQDNGDWELWIGLSQDDLQAVGYIPGALYGPGRPGQPFDKLQFGGEVSSHQQQTATGPMGSAGGRRPTGVTKDDFGRVAFIKYLAAQNAQGGNFHDVGDFQTMLPDQAAGYSCTLDTGHGFGTHIFFGGPNS